MFLFIERLAEEAIQKAQREGQFDNLPGQGRPLPEEDLALVPSDLRMAYKVLKNAGCLPPELEREKEIRTALELLADMTDEAARYRQIRKLNYLTLKLNLSRRRPVDLERAEIYYERIVERVRLAGEDGA